MSWQVGLNKEQQERILQVMKECKVSADASYQENGKPIHREVYLHISSYDDESEELEMYSGETPNAYMKRMRELIKTLQGSSQEEKR